MSKIIFIKNNKGGVGKSTIARNIASGLASIEKKVALVSFDSQNDSLIILGKEYIKGDAGLKTMVQTGEDYSIRVRDNLNYYPLETDVFSSQLREKLESFMNSLKEKYDYTLIDGAPSKDNFLSLVGSEIADEILVPITLDKLSLHGINRMSEESDFDKIKYIVPNLYGRLKIENDLYDEVKEIASIADIYLANPIPKSAVETNLANKGKTIWETNSKSASKIQEIYMDLVTEVI